MTTADRDLPAVVLGICAAVLRRSVTGADNFFDLVGTSLQAADFVVKLETALGTPVDLAAFLEARDLDDLTRSLTESTHR